MSRMAEAHAEQEDRSMDECEFQQTVQQWREFTEGQYVCPFCGKLWAQQNAPDGSDIACCGEISHCEPHDPDTVF